ncbi:MAG: GspH/FimT family pseudopilin [Gammaproteobacteria bacterium]|nr:GspH/FimT family pseudopilin [Gammaproteobacteria bacterium]
MTRIRGFTLYELLITVLIVGVILAFGAPNLREYRQNGRMTAAANDMLSTFLLARTEASRAKSTITICASDTRIADDVTIEDVNCGTDWEFGYIVFVETDPADIARSGSEALLGGQPAAPEGVSFAVANEAAYFSFAPTGLGRTIGANTPVSQIVMCDDRGNVRAAGGNSAARLFTVTPLGRATILRDESQITEKLSDWGKTCP